MPKSVPLAVTTAALLVVALVSGCGGETESQDPGGLLEHTWVVNKLIDGTGNLSVPLAEGGSLSLKFTADESVGGSAGVNSYSAQYKASEDGSMEFGTIASTMMAGAPDMMAQEQAFFKALGDVAAFRLEAGGLSLVDADGTTVIRAKPQENAALEGTDWSCTGFNSGGDAFVSLYAGTQITALFKEDRLSGSGGVNNYNAKYEAADGEMTIDAAIAMTKMAGSPEAMKQEQEYLDTLADVTRYTIEADTLMLYGRGDLMLVTYEAVR